MDDIKTWVMVLGFVGNIVTTIVVIVWSWAKMDKKIAIVDFKVDNVGRDLKEVKDNHLSHLAEDVKELNCKLNEHLINHNK